MKVLVTGGAGYIGSTICSALEEFGHTPVILDSLINGKIQFTKGRAFYKGDIGDRALLERIFKEHPEIKSTIHCAALIIVPESVEKPYEYFRENVAKSNQLFHDLADLGCKDFLISSSASLYDVSPTFMVTESSPLKPLSPYARTKMMMELVLSDFAAAYDVRGLSLRYFNPIGADPKMRSGAYAESPTHVLGRLVDVAEGKRPFFEITGVDWPTRDGSGIRDYIHVWDLALAHVKAIEKMESVFANLPAAEKRQLKIINLGTGNGVTVRELLAAFERVHGKKLPVKEAPSRPGDNAGSYTNADVAWTLLGWRAGLTLDQAISDALKWSKEKHKVLS